MAKLFNLSIPVSVFKEGETFIAYASVLDISTCADSLKEVKKNFEQLVRLFFEELDRKNTTHEALENLGWQKTRKSWQAPIEIEHQVENFQVPVKA